jgi:hypothetical protein
MAHEFGRRVSTQFLVFPISTRVDIIVYQHGKCFIFVKYYIVVIKFIETIKRVVYNKIDRQ